MTIRISGLSALTPGLSTQLTATVMTSTGTLLQPNVTWQSQAPAVATVSPEGLVTGVSTGTAEITATASGAVGRTFVIVQSPGSGTTSLTACGSISAPGAYVLASDLRGNGGCLNISGVANVRLDCGEHTVSDLRLGDVNVATLSNCSITNGLVLSDSAFVTITRASIAGQFTITNASSVQVSDSHIVGSGNAVFLATGAAGTVLSRDNISNTGSGTAAAVEFANGTNNQIVQSTIAGAYDGSHANVGTDDGIILDNETNDTIEGNTIESFFDIGIESINAMANVVITDNTFTNIGVGGVGSIYCTAWKSNTIRSNRTSNTPTLVFVGYQSDSTHCGANPPVPTFVNNQFVGNIFRNPVDGTLHRSGSSGPSMSVSTTGTVSGNLLQDNDFGSYNGPKLNPLSGFIDGGGNICGPTDPAISNFPCSSGSS